MKSTFDLPLFPDDEDELRRQLEQDARVKGTSPVSILDRLDTFVDRTMKNLGSVERKAPMRGYEKAFEDTLSESIRTTGKKARVLLQCFFFPYFQRFHLQVYPGYPHRLVTEKCRTVYLPESDVGALAAANKDDPLGSFRPDRRPPVSKPGRKVWYDGAGSGLHFDEEPAGFFPVNYSAMLNAIGTAAPTVPDAVEMLENLSPNWANAVVLLVDCEKRSARIDKCSFNRFAARVNTKPCIEHISGMVCFDPAYKAYQKSLREAYLASVNGTWAGYEGAAWDANDLKDHVLDEGLKKIEKKPTYDGLLKLLTCHDKPGYLCKHGAPVIKGEPALGEYTLARQFYLIEKREYHQWQWDTEKNLPTCKAPREVYPYVMFGA